MCSLLRRSCSSECRLLEVGDLRPQVLGLPLRLGAGPLLLLQLIGPGGDLLLGRLQRRGRRFEVAPEARHLSFEALDQGASRLHALREPGHRVPRVLAHDRLSCIALATTLAERLTPGEPAVKPELRQCLTG